MGLFDSFIQRRAEKKYQRALGNHSAQVALWNEEENQLSEMLTIVRDSIAGNSSKHFVDMNDYGFMITKDEFPIAHLEGVAYLEIVTSPTRYSGGYGGVSFPIFGRVRLNTGRTGGKIIPGNESISPTDQGNALVTNERIMFTGEKRTHEWKFDKLISMTHTPQGYTVFAPAGRGKPAGLGYGVSVSSEVQFRLELAAAFALDTLERFEQELTVEQTRHRDEKPIPPPPFT
jgi:hypothetical protein